MSHEGYIFLQQCPCKTGIIGKHIRNALCLISTNQRSLIWCNVTILSSKICWIFGKKKWDLNRQKNLIWHGWHRRIKARFPLGGGQNRYKGDISLVIRKLQPMMNGTLFLTAQFCQRNGKWPLRKVSAERSKSFWWNSKSFWWNSKSSMLELDFNAEIDRRVSGELEIIDHRPFSTTLVLKTIFGLLKYVSRTPTLTDPGSAPGMLFFWVE